MTRITLYEILFYSSLFLCVYAYGLYAFLLSGMVRLLRKKHRRSSSYTPRVTVLVPVYNEEKVVKEKIENCLALDYPKELLQVMVCSDCSTDRTAEIVKTFCGRGIAFVDYRERSGKTGVVNKSAPKAEGEIVVLTDANTMLQPDAVSKLVSMYSSEKIGAVLGQVKLVVPEGGHGLQKEILYRNFETDLKYNEGLFGATIGAFGGFYSIRKELFVPLPANAYSNDDLIIPMKILRRGYRVVFDKEAVSVEETGQTVEEEFRRRIRIGAGNFQSFFFLPGLLNPFRVKTFILYTSHKVLRWFSPFILLAIIISNILLFSQYPYAVFGYIQAGFYLLATVGCLFSKTRIIVPIASPIYHFVSMNIAVLFGFFRYLRGIKSAVWESTERASP